VASHTANVGVAAAPRTGPLFVGRETELAFLSALIRYQKTNVGFLHGIAGIGKSTLLSVLLQRITHSGTSVIHIDCRLVEPTERGFLSAVGAHDDLETLVKSLHAMRPPVVLALDHYELFRLMDTWMRQVLVPRLPEHVHVILAGRERPVAGWFAIERFHTIPLGPLSEDEARLLLEARGVGKVDASRLMSIARGHPLALTLASAGVVEHPELALEDAAMTRVLGELTRLYLDAVDDSQTRRVLEAASVVRRATGPLLAAMLDGIDPDDAVARLLDLPFVESSREGLVVHDAVKGAVAEFLRGANPDRYRQYRRAAWHELRREVREAVSVELWRYTADMLYLIDNPHVREAFFPSGSQPLAVEPARAEDAARIKAIARRHERHTAAAILERWWDVAPETFSVVRDRDGGVAGFFLLLDTRMLRAPYVAGDPVLALWNRHMREHPLPKGQTALGLRRWLDADRGESPCATQAACWLDAKRTYMVQRPALRRMYVVVQDVPTFWPAVETLGFRPLPQPVVDVDGAAYTSVCLDFGPGSVDGWLSRLAAAELGISEDPGIDSQARELVFNGKRVALTPLEFGLFCCLRDRAGQTVPRHELLQEVWGTSFAGGSNVVDAVVRSLRTKLGDSAHVVETVRGSGYRMRADWRIG
jgi:Transcriptional regulatory protein, C terminal